MGAVSWYCNGTSSCRCTWSCTPPAWCRRVALALHPPFKRRKPVMQQVDFHGVPLSAVEGRSSISRRALPWAATYRRLAPVHSRPLAADHYKDRLLADFEWLRWRRVEEDCPRISSPCPTNV